MSAFRESRHPGTHSRACRDRLRTPWEHGRSPCTVSRDPKGRRRICFLRRAKESSGCAATKPSDFAGHIELSGEADGSAAGDSKHAVGRVSRRCLSTGCYMDTKLTRSPARGAPVDEIGFAAITGAHFDGVLCVYFTPPRTRPDHVGSWRVRTGERDAFSLAARIPISSATILTAISSGVSAPISKPMGECTRWRVSLEIPSSSRAR